MADAVLGVLLLGAIGWLLWAVARRSGRRRSFNRRFVPMKEADQKQRDRPFHRSRYGITDQQWKDGRAFPTRRGDLVRSRSEARVADHLYARGLVYEYEPMVCGFRPDFFLPQHGIVIEYWSKFSENRKVKTAAYLRAGHALVSLESGKEVSVERDIDRQLYYKFRDMGLGPDGRTRLAR